MKQFWKKQLPAAFLALLMVICLVPAASAATADIRTSVNPGESITFSRNTFKTLYDADKTVSSEFSYLMFTDYSALDTYGTFAAKDKSGTTVTLAKKDLNYLWFYYDKTEISASIDCALDGLTFNANSSASGTLTLKFTLVGRNPSDQVTGVMEISVAETSSGGISYKVDAGKAIYFKEDDFEAFFDDRNSTDWFERVRFTSSDLDDWGQLYVYDSSKNQYFRVYESTVDDYWFYHSAEADRTDYQIDKLYFLANSNITNKTVTLNFTLDGLLSNDKVYGTLYIQIAGGSISVSDVSFSYTVAANDEITFNEDDFEKLFDSKVSSDWFERMEFTGASNLDAYGKLYGYDYVTKEYVRIYEKDINDEWFYLREAAGKSDWLIDDLCFEANASANGKTVALNFVLEGISGKEVTGTLTIKIGNTSGTQITTGDITYTVDAKKEVTFDRKDFRTFFEKTYSDFSYVKFTDSSNLNKNGYLYSYAYSAAAKDFIKINFTENDISIGQFYYYDSAVEADTTYGYTLDDLTFVADADASGTVTLDFTAYGKTATQRVNGTVVIKIGDEKATSSSNYVGSVRYSTTPGTAVQINANDLARYFKAQYPGYDLQFVSLQGVPSTGSLYYNYYNASSYGTSTRAQVTAYNCASQVFYASPTSAAQYALTELTYIPSGSNYCASIPFVAYGSSSRAVAGSILISVTNKAVPEVYSTLTKNTSVYLPPSAINTVVTSATGSGISGIQLLALPTAKQGALYCGSTAADTTTLYRYSGTTQTISQLRFVPTAGYTGSVEIPYIAFNASGAASAVGKFCIGVVNSVKTFSDVPSNFWCYKYVTELSDTSVISGYTDGTFKPNNTVTYGAALKLIMLAAGYPEQPATGSNVFSGYLAKAQADGLVSGNINLTKSITRLEVAQLAAKAMKLNTSNLSSVKPFTDTTDPYVQALNAAGIVEGYFSNGTSTFKPNNTLTRGQVSAIVWRMQNSK